MSEQQNIIYKVKEHIGVISRHNGWTTELNIISWNNGTPKFDVRDWNSDHSRMSRGITLTDYEMRSLIGLYMGIHNNMVWNAAKEKEAERKRQAEEYFKNRGRSLTLNLNVWRKKISKVQCRRRNGMKRLYIPRTSVKCCIMAHLMMLLQVQILQARQNRLAQEKAQKKTPKALIEKMTGKKNLPPFKRISNQTAPENI